MKKCAWCGKEYPEAAEFCATDREPLASPEAAAVDPAVPEPTQSSPQFIDLRKLASAFTEQEGFSRPDWKLIGSVVEKTVPLENRGAAWTEIATQWLEEIRSDLGGDYWVTTSNNFILLSAIKPEQADQLLRFAQDTRKRVHSLLGDLAWKTARGKHVILLFTDTDDYYQYISFFHAEGHYATNSGCLIRRGYVHIAIPYTDGRYIRRVFVHEFAHNSVIHLPLPTWVNEGLAMFFERMLEPIPGELIIDHDARDRHLSFWNAENIQRFWAGKSFYEPGEPNELSYSLAQILLNLLLQEQRDIASFVRLARRDDAGQTAALDCLNVDLGDLAATFLGPGDWRPNRKKIVECWKSPAEEKPAAKPGGA
jgi:hypothetical protein